MKSSAKNQTKYSNPYTNVKIVVIAAKRPLEPNRNAAPNDNALTLKNPVVVFMSKAEFSKYALITSVYERVKFAITIITATHAINFQSTNDKSFFQSQVRVSVQ